jgi:hypothetical protein
METGIVNFKTTTLVDREESDLEDCKLNRHEGTVTMQLEKSERDDVWERSMKLNSTENQLETTIVGTLTRNELLFITVISHLML